MARSNDAAADALRELADLVAISGADTFRIRAYERAARAVAGYHLDVDDLDRKALLEIPGVGGVIADKLLELRSSGHIAELDDYRAQVPAGLRSLLDVPGLGPKRAKQAYDELGIASLPELLDALDHERLRTLKGWGPKSEEALRTAIRRHQAAGGRLLLSAALDLAETLLADLRELPDVADAAYAGSLRRMTETVGDVDLLVATDQPERVMAAFRQLDPVHDVLLTGPTKTSVVTGRGVQVDLRAVPPAVWGAALVYFTGSKAHNVRLRERAIRQGTKLSEYGLFRSDDAGADGAEDLVAAASEEEVYAALGLDWIPPTLREDRGEVAAAAAHALPRVVQVSDLRGDLHMHTDLTDGLAPAGAMVEAASARGYDYCAVTDHAPLLFMQAMTPERALEQRAELARLAADHGIAVLHGAELNIAEDGSLDWPEQFLATFDVLVASVHSRFDQPREAMTRRLVTAIEHPCVNIIGHPTTRQLGRRPPTDFDADAVFTAAARTGTALEINAFPDRLDLRDELARRAYELGAVFSIDTDSHSVLHLDNARFGVAMAQRAWLPPERVVNTWPLDRLRAFVAAKRR